jgi:DNA-binding transcriptional MerR regulator
MPEDGYRGPQVCTIVGITYRQLDYWARTDLIRPSLADARGSGTQRIYSYRDLVELKVIKSLLDAGVSLQSARRAIEYLRNNLGPQRRRAHRPRPPGPGRPEHRAVGRDGRRDRRRDHRSAPA